MATKIGINGFGRIGRQVLKAITDRYPSELEVVAINDLVEPEVSANLLKYDSNYGRWDRDVRASAGAITVDGREIRVFAERDPGAIPWGSAGVELVVESTGFFTDATKAEMKKILGEIQSGEFADEWMSECDSGKENFVRMEEEGKAHPIEEVGARLRSMMPWLEQDRLVNSEKI